MGAKKKVEQVVVVENDQAVEIQVRGDLLPNNVYLQIIGIISEHRETKKIHFTVYNYSMALTIHDFIPSEFYSKLELKAA